MASEPKRRCGYRKVGATYLEAQPGGFACGRLPVELTPCPLCDHSPRFTRGLQRITPRNVLHSAPVCALGALGGGLGRAATERCAVCPFGKILETEVAGLAWVGAKFYTPETFGEEAAALGISKRIPWPLPKWLQLGATWIFLAHERVFTVLCPTCKGARLVPLPGAAVGTECPDCDDGHADKPGLFRAFVPQRVVRIITTAMPQGERDQLLAQGLHLVEVAAADPDHQPGKSRGEEE